MKRATVRDLHLKTSDMLKEVAKGGVFLVEKKGVPIAELRPVQTLPPPRRLPNREAITGKLPFDLLDSGRIFEQDRHVPASPNTLSKIRSTLRNWRSSEKASAICSGVSTARISGSASIAARKSDSSSHAFIACACTTR